MLCTAHKYHQCQWKWYICFQLYWWIRVIVDQNLSYILFSHWFGMKCSTADWRRRQRGRVVRVRDLKFGDPEFKSHSNHQLDLFQVVPGSTPWLHLYIPNWSASHQVGLLTHYVFFSSLSWSWKALAGRDQLSVHIYIIATCICKAFFCFFFFSDMSQDRGSHYNCWEWHPGKW